MEDVRAEPKLFFPGLQKFYELAIPLSWLIVRIGAGWLLVVHGWGKVTRGAAPYVKGFNDLGFDPALPWIYSALFIEFVGGIAIIIGLFTRFFAAAAAIEMAYIMFALYLPNGFSWTARGYEFVLLWGLVFVAIWLRGGGPYSVDRLLKRQL